MTARFTPQKCSWHWWHRFDFFFSLFKISLINATFKCFFFLASWWSFYAPGRRERATLRGLVTIPRWNSLWRAAIQLVDPTQARGGERDREAQGRVPWPSLWPWSRPGGSILCFPFQLVFYILFRLTAPSQARKREAPAGRLHFGAGLRWEHRVTPLMKGRDGLARLQAGHLLLTNVSKQASGSWSKKKKRRGNVVPQVQSDRVTLILPGVHHCY